MFGAARSGDYELHDDGTATVAGHLLQPDEFTLGVESPEGVTAAALGSGDAVVVLDTEVTADLAREGLARDVVRQVQQARRDAELVVTDRIRLVLDGGDAVVDAVRVHEDHVAGQVLATEVVYGPVEDDSVGAVVVTLEGAELRFRFSVT